VERTLNTTRAKRSTNAKVRRRQPTEVKSRVMQAALHEFATYGFDGATLRSIAKDAHVSISLLIYHFKSKNDLWRDVIDDVFTRMAAVEVIGEREFESAPASEKLRAVVGRMVRLFSRYPALHRLMTLEGHQMNERLIWMCEKYIKRNSDALCALIFRGQQEGAVIEGDPARIRLAITAMAAVPFSVSAEYQYLTKTSPFSAPEIEANIKLIEDLLFIPKPTAVRKRKPPRRGPFRVPVQVE
jgi:AcrR family transcriptional regulator